MLQETIFLLLLVKGALFVSYGKFHDFMAFGHKIKQLPEILRTASFAGGNDEMPSSQPRGFDQINA
jgi:hypothetical protein